MDTRVLTKEITDHEVAIAIAVKAVTSGKQIGLKPLPDGGFEVVVQQADAALLDAGLHPAYTLIQEGGSSLERYFHAHNSEADALNDRIDCTKGSYRTTPPVRISPILAALGEYFYEAVDTIIGTLNELDYVDVSPDDDEEAQSPGA